MVKRSELRARARKILGGHIFTNAWLLTGLAALIVSFILNVGNTTWVRYSDGYLSVNYNFVSVVGLVLGGSLSAGLCGLLLLSARGKEKVDLGDLFKDFGPNFAQRFLLGLMKGIFTFLWTLLFIIPGIVKSYAYSMAYYLSADHPDWKWKECLTESQRLMRGHKGQLFGLHLSFIGWAVVCILTGGIGFFWLSPYMKMAETAFYLELTGTNEPGPAAGDTPENVVL